MRGNRWCARFAQLMFQAAPVALPVGGGYVSQEVPLAAPLAPPEAAVDVEVLEDDFAPMLKRRLFLPRGDIAG